MDGKLIKRNIRGWQKIIGYVPQKTFIIEDTLKNNILFGLDKEKINENYFREVFIEIKLKSIDI